MTRSAERQHLEEALAVVLDLSGEEARGGVRVNFPEKVKEMFTEGNNQIYDIEIEMVRALSRITGLPQEKLTIAEAADRLLAKQAARVVMVEMPIASARDDLAVMAESSSMSISDADVVVGVWENGEHHVLKDRGEIEVVVIRGRSLQ